jgi:hypothetical protein
MDFAFDIYNIALINQFLKKEKNKIKENIFVSNNLESTIYV